MATNLLSAGSDPEVPADKRLSVTLASQSARSVSDGVGAINQTRPREISPGFFAITHFVAVIWTCVSFYFRTFFFYLGQLLVKSYSETVSFAEDAFAAVKLRLGAHDGNGSMDSRSFTIAQVARKALASPMQIMNLSSPGPATC